MSSLAENFKHNKSSFIITNETWFKEKDPQFKKMLEDLEDEYDVKAIRKDRKIERSGKAHGGVAVFFDSTKCTLKRFPLNALKSREAREYEILAVRGNPHSVKKGNSHFSLLRPT